MDTTNHVERHWELIKYTLLQGKVNRSLRDLIVAIVGSAKDGTRVGQPTLLNQFKMTQRISDSERFSRRGNDNGHRRRLKGGERIFKSYQSAPSNVLQVMDEAHLLFRVQSESNDGTWYNVSLNTHFCDCPDRNSTCKHILGVQLIVKGYFKATRENEIVEEMMPMEEDIICAALISPTNMGVEVGGPSVLDDSSVKLLSAIAEAETLLQSVKTSIGDHTEDEKKHKVQVLQKFLTSFSEPFTFERPATIDLPRRGSISVIQENVKRTRMGHGKKSCCNREC